MICRRPEKVKYLTRREARRAARRIHNGERLSAYRCECGFFHLGRLAEFTVAGYSLDRWNAKQRGGLTSGQE